MTDDRAREEFALNARVHIAALQSALARQLFRRDARNAAVTRCVEDLTECAWILAEAHATEVSDARVRDCRRVYVDPLSARVLELEDELTDARNAQQAPHGAGSAPEATAAPAKATGKATPARRRTSRPSAPKVDT